MQPICWNNRDTFEDIHEGTGAEILFSRMYKHLKKEER